LLHVNDPKHFATAQNRYGQKRFEAVIRGLMERLISRIVESVALNRKWPLVLCYPTSNVVAKRQSEVV
jgi:hypothetical protein